MSRYYFVEVEDKYEGGFRNTLQTTKGVVRFEPLTMTGSILDSLQEERISKEGGK